MAHPGHPRRRHEAGARRVKKSDGHHAVPVLVAYNIPGRDCGLYSAGGAQTTEAYAAWIDGVATGIGDAKVVVILEPDGLASMDCLTPEHAADRLAQFNLAVDRLEQQPQRGRLPRRRKQPLAGRRDDRVAARRRRVSARAQGFFLNVSNYNPTDAETHYGTWVSECIAFGQDTEEGGWRLGHYDWCASQYYSPFGPVNPDDTSTWHFTDDWYDGEHRDGRPDDALRRRHEPQRPGRLDAAAASYPRRAGLVQPARPRRSGSGRPRTPACRSWTRTSG